MDGTVLIVGAGIAGLGLARALHLRGVRCSVLDRAPSSAAPGLGVNLPGNAVQALAALGLAEDVVRGGVPIRRREYRTGSGRLLFAVDEEAFWGSVGPSTCVYRESLLNVLRAGAAEVPTRWDTGVVGVEAVAEGVRVQLDSGATEIHDFVVGADGVRSAVRPFVLGEGPGQSGLSLSPMAETSWRFIAPNPGVSCWTVWSGRAGTLLLIPVAEDLVYGYASATRGGASGADPRWLAETFTDFPEPVAQTVAAVTADERTLLHSPVLEVRCDRWSRGKVVLIGDAAHATAPVWAQGAALALEDALVLADLLATRSDWSGVGAAFEQRRRARVAHVQAVTDRMTKIAGLPNGLRDVVAPVLGPRAYRAAYEPLRTPVTTSV